MAEMDTPLVELRSLARYCRRCEAVRGISLSLRRGEILREGGRITEHRVEGLLERLKA